METNEELKPEETTRQEAVKTPEVELKFNGVAIASFVCSLVGLFYYQFPCGVAALITGIIGVIKFDNNKEKGKWMAIVGIVLGAIEILFTILVVFLGVSIFMTALTKIE